MNTSSSCSCLVGLLTLLLSAFPASADTAAYYRFEHGESGRSLGNATNQSVRDDSGRHHHLNAALNPVASTDVPARLVSYSGKENTLSARFTGAEDLYGTAGDGLSRVVFTSFTIEAWVKFDSLVGWQTLVGRDDSGSPGEGEGQQSLFYLSKAADSKITDPGIMKNGLRVELVTRDNQLLAFNSYFDVSAHTWYHVAVVGDSAAGTLALYVNGTEVGGTTGFNGLFVPTRNSPWTLGRGQYNGKLVDRFIGLLDEVRFSDEALPPSRFLNAAPPAP